MKLIVRMSRSKASSLKIWSCVLLLLSVCCSCDDDNSNPGDSSVWTPGVQISKGNTEATLSLIDPRPFSSYAGKPPSDPDFFNIWISNNLTDFELYRSVEPPTSMVLIDHLENGKTYYILVTTHKGENLIGSDTLMTIPSAEQKREVLVPDLNFSMERLSTSYDMRYLTFNSNTYGGGSSDVLYYKDNNSGAVNPLATNPQGASWSGTANHLVYLTTRDEGNVRYPFALQLFDPESKASTTLFETPYNSYYVANPTFTTDGGKVAFLSSENNSEKNIYDLWTINPANKEKVRVTNFKDLGFFMDGNYSLSKSGDEIYLDGRHDIAKYKIAIYKLNLSTKQFTPVIETRWNDRAPKLSPDNMKLAFISGRTGKDELWIYELANAKYTQITGEPSYRFDSRYTNLEWISNEQMLITVFEGSKSTPIKINVN